MKRKHLAILLSAAVLSFVLLPCGCGAGNLEEQHIHRWSNEWESGGGYHWQVCLDCGAKSTKALHDFSSGACLCGRVRLEGTAGLRYALNEKGDGYTVTGMETGEATELSVATEYEGKPVTKIGESAFAGCASLTAVTLPDTIEEICDSAFAGCVSLAEITIPSNVWRVCPNAFSRCYALTVFFEAKKVYQRAAKDFDDYRNESGTVWYVNDLYSGNNPFVSDCRHNRFADDGYFYTVIGGVRYALKDGEARIARQPQSLAGEVVISGSIAYGSGDYALKGMDEAAFYGCTRLTSVTIEEGALAALPAGAFEDCTSLRTVSLGAGIAAIGARAFEGCTSLAELALPAGVTEIYGSAFCDSGLQSIAIPNGVTRIREMALCGLRRVVIPASVKTIERMPFGNLFSGQIQGIYYEGSEEDWTKIEFVAPQNIFWQTEPVFYYSETEPEQEGRYWHYGEDKKTVVEWNS